jgi:hypothetical protein
MSLKFQSRSCQAKWSTISRDRKKLNSGVRVRGAIKFIELGKFKLAIFKKSSVKKVQVSHFSKKQELVKFKLDFFQNPKSAKLELAQCPKC